MTEKSTIFSIVTRIDLLNYIMAGNGGGSGSGQASSSASSPKRTSAI